MEENRGVAALEAWTRPRPWVADTGLAVAVAVLLLPASIDVVVSAPWPIASRVALVAVLVMMHGCIAVRRVVPRVAFVAVCAAMLVLVATPDIESPAMTDTYGVAVPVILVPSSIVFSVLLYSVAAGRPAQDAMRALAVGAVGVMLTTARLWSVDVSVSAELGPITWRALMLIAIVAAVAVPWELGRLRYVRGQYLDALAERARRDERGRIARELHDVVSHSLAVMVSQAEGARMMARRDPAVTVPALETIARTGQEAMQGMRGLLDALDPDTRDRTPQPTLADLDELLDKARGAGISVQREHVGSDDVAAASGLVAYRVVQESLTNVLKHVGPGATVRVALAVEAGTLQVLVQDDGGPGIAVHHGRGLTGMRDRVVALDGTFEAGPSSTGFTVRARVPAHGGPR